MKNIIFGIVIGVFATLYFLSRRPEGKFEYWNNDGTYFYLDGLKGEPIQDVKTVTRSDYADSISICTYCDGTGGHAYAEAGFYFTCVVCKGDGYIVDDEPPITDQQNRSNDI